MNLKEVRDLLKDHDLLISYANLEMDQDQNVVGRDIGMILMLLWMKRFT